MNIWKITEDFDQIITLGEHKDFVRCIDISEDCKYLSSSGDDKEIKIAYLNCNNPTL